MLNRLFIIVGLLAILALAAAFVVPNFIQWGDYRGRLQEMASETLGAPVEITELTSGLGEDDPSLTADLLEIYFGSRRTGGQGFEDIWRATRSSKDAAWGTPENVTALNSSSAETTATFRGSAAAPCPNRK